MIRRVLVLLGVCVFAAVTAGAQTISDKPLVIISESNSTRAIAFDSVNFRKEPFELSTPFASDGRTRIMVFALNLTFAPNETVSAITADAETAAHTHHSLQVEYAAPLSTLPWLSFLTLRLNDQLDEAGDVLLSLTFHGLRSNRVRIGIGHLAGGPPDDDGALPTPAPPYTISGRVTSANGQGISGVNLVLSGDQNQAFISDESGNYSFLINTFGSYSLNAFKPFFNVSPALRTFNNLSSNHANINFSTARKTPNVSGAILDDHNNPLAGVAVTLSDENNVPLRTITTTSGGAYVFTEVPAGFNYRVSPGMTPVFTFASQSINALDGDVVLNFVAAKRKYIISGRITDGNNAGVTGVNLILSGSETSATRSDSNGNYSFSATVLGDYTVTAAIEQDYFSFTPTSQTVVALVGDKLLNFNATLKPLPDPGRVMEFNGAPKTVDYRNFWPPFTNLGHFFWEFWAMPFADAGGTYLLADGYGGAHALLFGFSNFGASEANRYEMSGNINDGVANSSHIFTFGSDHGPAIGEWCHLAVGWDGQWIITYLNGVPVGKTPYALPRQSLGPGNGAGRLLIGGSDHSNLRGRIAQVRGYEGSNPRENDSVESSFVPQTVFTLEGNLLSYYFTPAPVVADLSRGYLTGTHVGVPRGTLTGVLSDCGSCPPPFFVIDPTAPNFATGTASRPVSVPTPPSVPAAALVFDSFSRANSTYTFGAKGGLGLTEGGAAGVQAWQMMEGAGQLKPFGILNGRAVLLANDTALCWINTASASANLDIRVSRKRGRWGSGTNTGLSFRVADKSNYFFAYTSDSIPSPGNQFLNVGYYLNGTRSMLVGGVSVPAGWTTLRVVTRSNGSIVVFIDATEVYSTTNTTLAAATKAGLFNNSAGLGLVNRWDDFMVFEAAP